MPIDEYGLSVCDHLRSANHSLSVQLAKAEARAEGIADELGKYIRCELCGRDNDPTCPRCVRRETIEEAIKRIEEWKQDCLAFWGDHVGYFQGIEACLNQIRRLIKQPVPE